MNVWRAFPFLIFAFALLWYGALVLRFPTHGAIGDDPATYVLMARDLAQRGTVVHEFPLFTKLFEAGLSWDAFITPGYHVVRETGFIAPNFAFGFPLLLAFAARVFGDNALYWATPFMGALTLIVTFMLGNELLRDFSAMKRQTVSALAVLMLAVSPKQIQLALVPMSDVPTQLFCMVALWCALRVRRETQRVFETDASPIAFAPKTLWVLYTFAALCGFSLGMAYLIRHSALAMIMPLGIVVWCWGESLKQRVALVAVAVIAFAIVLVPDVSYRANVLGSVFAVESPESAQIVWLDAPRQFLGMLGALLSVTGFGSLILFVPFGWWILAREKNRFAALVLASWIGAFMLLHAPLRLTGVFENSLRYLIPAYPAIALSASFAVIWVFERAWNGMRAAQTRFTRRSFVVYALALLCLVALAIALRAVVGPERFASRAYGRVSAEARGDLELLNAQLPRDAVIGVSDQMAGATLLYAQRAMFRPGAMTRDETEFIQFLAATTQPMYFLGDWNCSFAANSSERLPQWLSKMHLTRTKFSVRGLPYECIQSIHELKGE